MSQSEARFPSPEITRKSLSLVCFLLRESKWRSSVTLQVMSHPRKLRDLLIGPGVIAAGSPPFSLFLLQSFSSLVCYL